MRVMEKRFSYRTAAVVLAAGFSSRMGRFKPLLDIGGKTAVDRLIATFFGAGVDDIIVVTGHRAEELATAVSTAGARAIVNRRFEEGMFSSIQAGAAALSDDVEAFFLQPVDIPLIRRETVQTLLASFTTKEAGVLYPCFAGRRGHPPLLSATLRQGIAAWPGNDGLRGFLQTHEAEALDVAVDDPGVLRDMDTPEDYERMKNLAFEP